MKLYNTLTRNIEAIEPLQPPHVSIYTCGLTVYSQPHIGNWVAYIYWDLLVRALKLEGLKVNRVQNITDVGHLTSDEDAGEDKMLTSALKEGTTAWQVAEKYIQIADDEAYNQLGLLRPDHMPRATEYITQQIAFVEELERKGFTYKIDDGIYFDTSKLSDYGKLAKLDIEGLRFGARVEDTGKKNPTDFAVWKFSPADQKRDMEWDSPWGKGFPGWHLECSVMAKELLGEEIDIHTGGIDHIPVHHTNEIAQTEAITSKPFARTWVHANHMKVNGTKMSKSLGNIFTLQDIREKGYDLRAFKLLVLSKHYRTEGNFTWEILDAAAARLKTYQAMADLRFQPVEHTSEGTILFTEAWQAIEDAIQDDLGSPQALERLSSLESMLSETLVAQDSVKAFNELLTKLDELLGLDLLSSQDITDEQKAILTERQKARDNKQWESSDSLREQLAEQGVAVRDTPRGQIWSRL